MKHKNYTIGYVYMITSPSGRIYIGSTKDLKERERYYRYFKHKKQRKLYNSCLKYGWKAHTFEIIWTGEYKDMLSKEAILGHFYNVLDKFKGMNLQLPKIDDIASGISDSTRLKMRNNKLGTHPSLKTLNELSNIRKKPILQYTLDGEFVKEWDCINDASNFYKITPQNISRCCKGRYETSAGYKWEYKFKEIENNKIKGKTKKQQNYE